MIPGRVGVKFMLRRVLFVDDDLIMLQAIEKRFAAYSGLFSMLMANDGFDAIKKLKEHAVSLIVLDLKMPRMDGMSFLNHTRENYPDIPVIIVSGYRTSEMYKLAKAQGVIAYISKPFQVDDLGKVITSTLQKEAEGGTMHKVSPPVFMQLMEMEGKTCTIRALDSASNQGGVLYFKDGSLLDARAGTKHGIDAAYRIFSWENITIFIQNDCSDRENVINSNLQPIIMQAVSMKDEAEGTTDAEFEDEIEDELPISSLSSDMLSEENSEELDEETASLDEGLPDDFFSGSSEFIESDIDESAKDLEMAQSESKQQELGVEEDAPVIIEPVTPSVSPKSQNDSSPVKRTRLQTVELLVERVLGKNSGVTDIDEDASWSNKVSLLEELGGMVGLGKLKVSYLCDNQRNGLVLFPGSSVIVLHVEQRCSRDELIHALSNI